ncbi:MAG: transaldolase family protein [Sphingobacteriales bacterium]
MKFFIVTANLAPIKEASEPGILSGVITNPSLMAKEGISDVAAVLKHNAAICELADGDISAGFLLTDFDSIIKEGKVLAAIHPTIIVKVPMIKMV